MYRKSKLEI